jgi:DNA-binding NarL/FixJ family response regulator
VSSISVLVADDQPLVRAGFRLIIESEPDLEIVGEAGDGVEAVREAMALRPDVVLMDIRMPQLDGVEATRRLAGPDVDAPLKVLVLTTFDLDEYVYESLRAGASGFLLKDVPADDLVAAIRTVAAGDAVVAPAITRRLIDRFAPLLPPSGAGGGDAPGDGGAARQLSSLTERELDVLRLMARGYSNAEIAGELFVAETTVKTHVGRVLSKLGLRDRVHAVVYAYESGLVRPGGTDRSSPG